MHFLNILSSVGVHKSYCQQPSSCKDSFIVKISAQASTNDSVYWLLLSRRLVLYTKKVKIIVAKCKSIFLLFFTVIRN